MLTKTINLFLGNPVSKIKLTLIFLLLIGLLILILDFSTTKSFLSFIGTTNIIHQIKDQDGFVNYRKVTKRNLLNFKGTIFIFPPTGGENIVDRLYARQLAIKGYEVFILQKWTGYEIETINYELHNSFYGSAQVALNKVLKYSSTKNYGVLGTSVGALHASVTMATNPYIKTGFIIVGGLPIPEVIIFSNQPAMTELKSKRYTKYNLKNDEQYLKELSQVFKFEPTTQHANYSIGKKIGSIVSTNDELVPYLNQQKANDFFKASSVEVSHLNHVNTVAWYGLFNRSKVVDFFVENL